jgi:hypothetical protein
VTRKATTSNAGVAGQREAEHDVHEAPDVEPAERDVELCVYRAREDEVERPAAHLAGQPPEAWPQHRLDDAGEGVEHAEEDHDLPVVPPAEPRGVTEEERDREQRHRHPEQCTEHAGHEVPAVLKLLHHVDLPERPQHRRRATPHERA